MQEEKKEIETIEEEITEEKETLVQKEVTTESLLKDWQEELHGKISKMHSDQLETSCSLMSDVRKKKEELKYQIKTKFIIHPSSFHIKIIIIFISQKKKFINIFALFLFH